MLQQRFFLQRFSLGKLHFGLQPQLSIFGKCQLQVLIFGMHSLGKLKCFLWQQPLLQHG